MKNPHILMDLLEAAIRERDADDYGGHDEAYGAYLATLHRAESAPDAPKIVCLCGSTRFYEEFQQANLEQTLLGNIVLSVGYYPHGGSKHWLESTITAEDKVKLDELHKRKIDLCDVVLVLNKDGYIGDSTRSEIEYALTHGKPVEYMEPNDAGFLG